MFAILSKKFLEKLKRKTYRDEYVAEGVRTGISYQIRALRDQRGWSQKILAEKMDKPQSVVSRIEDPDYGKFGVQTLLEVASAFDIGLVIKFVALPDFIRLTKDVSPEALEAESYNDLQFSSDIPLPVMEFYELVGPQIVPYRYDDPTQLLPIITVTPRATTRTVSFH